MQPILIVIAVAAIITLGAWITSIVTGDSSQVDRLWSIVPAVYAWILAIGYGFNSVALLLVTLLITVWAARLTFNFARKGGYSGVEDYRWPILREGMKPWQYQIFSLLFIHIYQMTLLVLIVLPVWQVAENPTGATSAPIWLLAVAFLALLFFETLADQQQWDFHRHKKSEAAAGRQVSPGFLDTGLFAFSRHPNYFGEIGQWWVIYLFGVTAIGTWVSWTGIGAGLLTLLFVGSTVMTENISASKYPEYVDYQRRVSAIIPFFPKRSGKTQQND